MAASNEQVVAAWAEGREAQGGNLKSTGKNLYSYGLRIGGTVSAKGKQVKVVGDFTAKGGGFFSMTTSHHGSRAKGVADVVFSPREWQQ